MTGSSVQETSAGTLGQFISGITRKLNDTSILAGADGTWEEVGLKKSVVSLAYVVRSKDVQQI